MSTKTEELKELEVLTPEQIEVLPEEVKENVVYLTDNMNTKDLMVLNPIVKELLAIKDDVDNLEMKPIGEDGKYDKENIQTFVDAKKRIRSFRSNLKSSATTLKEPYLAIQKSVIAIEKSIKAEADEAYEKAEKTFAEYVKYEEDLKAERQSKKDAALQAKVDEANSAAEEANAKMEKTNIYNKIKFDLINAKVVEATQDALLNGNKQRLEFLKSEFEAHDYHSAISGIDDSILDEEVRLELQAYYDKSVKNSIGLINDKLKSIQTEIDNKILSSGNKTEEVKEVPLVPVPPVPEVNYNDFSDEELVNHISEKALKLLTLTQDRIKLNPSCSPKIYDLRNILSDLLN